MSPGQVDYDAPVAGVFFTTTIQNILIFAAVTAIVIVGLPTIEIVIVASAAAAATNRVSKVSNQRQLRWTWRVIWQRRDCWHADLLSGQMVVLDSYAVCWLTVVGSLKERPGKSPKLIPNA